MHIKTTDFLGSVLFECFLFFLQNLTNAAIYKCPRIPSKLSESILWGGKKTDFCIRICMRVISHSVTQGRGHFSFTFWKQQHQQHFFNRTDCFVNSKADGFYLDEVWKGCIGFHSILINDHCTMPRIHKWNGVLKNDIYSFYHVIGVFFFYNAFTTVNILEKLLFKKLEKEEILHLYGKRVPPF